MRYYVTAIDGKKVHFLAGPYETRAKAEDCVDAVRKIACDFERNRSAGRAAFMAYGVTGWTDDETAPKSALGVMQI